MARMTARGVTVRGVSVLAAAVLATPVAMAVVPQYRVVDMSNYGAQTAYRVTGISPNSNYLTSMTFTTGVNTPAGGMAVLSSGVATGSFLPTLTGAPGTYINIDGVNDNGIAIGTVGGNNRGGVPVAWSNGVAYELGLPAGFGTVGSFNYGGEVNGITADGQITGAVGAGTPRAVIWHTSVDSQTGVLTVNFIEQLGALPTTGGTISNPYGTASNGWMAGPATDPANASRTQGYVRDPDGGYYEDIGGPTMRTTLPFAINDNAEAVGSATTMTGESGAFKWTPQDGMTLLPMVHAGNGASAKGVNNSGIIVGTDYNAAVQGNISTGFVSDGTRTFLLNDIVGGAGAVWDLQAPMGVSDAGIIVGQAFHGLPQTDALGFAVVPVAGTGTTGWVATGSGNWSDAGNWSDGVADSNTYTAVFSQSINSAATVTLDGSRTVQGLTLNSPYGYTIASNPGAVLTFSSGTSDPAAITVPLGNQTISATLNLASETDMAVRLGFTLTVSGVIGGTASPNIAGPGLVTFTGANTYSTPTIVSGGTFRGVDGVGLPTNSVLTLTGGVYETSGLFTRSLGSSGANKVSFPAGATGGFSAFGGPLTVNIGGATPATTLVYGNPSFSPAAITLNGVGANNTVTFLNPIQLGGTSFTLNVLSPTQPATLAGAITGTGNVVKDGVGTLILSSPSNNYVGTMTVNAGTLKLATGSGLTGSVTINSGATFDPTASANPFALAGSQTLTVVAGGNLVGALGGSGTVAFTGGAQTFSNLIGGSNAVVVAGGPVTLPTANTYTGPTTITSGSLRATQGVGLPNASNLTLAGGVYETSGSITRALGSGAGQVQLPSGASGFSALGGALAVSIGGGSPTSLTWGSAAFNPSTLVLNTTAADSAISFANPVALGGAMRTFAVGANVATMSGAVTGTGASGLTKIGAGVLALTATNSYLSPTIIGGGAVRAVDGVGLPTASNLVLAGGVFESHGTFNRGLGTGAAQVQFAGVGGFSAAGGDLAVTLGAGNPSLTWGSGLFSPTTLILNGATSTSNVTLTNAMDIGTSTASLEVDGNIGTLAGAVTGTTGGLNKVGAGVLQLAAANSYSGPTIVSGGSLRAVDGVGLPTVSNLTLNGGVFESSGTVARDLGSGAGQVQLTGTSGFSASGGPLAINLQGGSTITWGTGGTDSFSPSLLVLNGASATSPLTVLNQISFSGSAKRVSVMAGTATFAGNLIGGNAQVLYKYGPGRLVLAGDNNGFSSTVRIVEGSVALGATTGFNSAVVLDSNVSFDVSAAGNPWNSGSAVFLNFLGSNSQLVGNMGGAGTINFSSGTNTITGNLSGAVIVKNNNGAIGILAGTNTNTGATQVTGGVLRGNLSPNSLLTLSGGVYEGSGNFIRPVGSSPGAVQLTAGTTGFSAFGGPLTINLGNNGGNFTWGSSNRLMTNLVLNEVTANSPLTFVNPINLNGVAAATRGIYVNANTSTLTGALSGGATLVKQGAGTLVLANLSNANTGPMIVNAGTLTLGTTGAVSGVAQITVAGTGAFDVSAHTGGYTVPAAQFLTFTDAGKLAGSFTASNTVSFIPTGTAVIPANLAGSMGISVANGTTAAVGALTFSGSLTYTGNTAVSAPNANVTFATPLKPGTGTLAVTGAGGRVTLNPTSYASASAYSTAGLFGGMTVGAPGQSPVSTVAIAPTNRSAVKASVVVTTGLNIAANGGGFSGFVDVGNNDMIIKGGAASLSTLRSYVAGWLATPGTGLGSSVASTGAAPYTTVAVFSNDAAGSPYFSSYDGVALTNADAIVKYTYVGDTNLDGVLDGADLSNLIEGLSTGRTGWANGDLDYSGGVTVADLTAFNAAYSYFTSNGMPSLGNGAGGGSDGGSVPEPTSLALFAAAALPLTRRRR